MRTRRAGTAWIVLAMLWPVAAQATSAEELAAGAIAAVAAVAAAVAAGRASRQVWHVHARWVRWFAGVPDRLVRETAGIARLIGTRRPARARSRSAGPYPDASRRAVATLALSATPAAFVVDERDDCLVVRELVLTSGGPDE